MRRLPGAADGPGQDLDDTDLGAPLADRANESADRGGGTLGARAEYDALLDVVASGAGAREGF
jgi:hypothetical protein